MIDLTQVPPKAPKMELILVRAFIPLLKGQDYPIVSAPRLTFYSFLA